MKKDIFFSVFRALIKLSLYVLHDCGELPSALGKMLTLPALLIADSGVQ
jgi:hypothetical protein